MTTQESQKTSQSDRHVKIFDTTLRDGEQSPGCSMNHVEKLEFARALSLLGVDIIEAGFPIASNGDFESVRAIATEITGSSICGLARSNERDIARAWEALQFAQKPRIHVFLATSAIHREHKLRMSRDQIIAKAVESVTFARSLCADIEFSPEDAARTALLALLSFNPSIQGQKIDLSRTYSNEFARRAKGRFKA